MRKLKSQKKKLRVFQKIKSDKGLWDWMDNYVSDKKTEKRLAKFKKDLDWMINYNKTLTKKKSIHDQLAELRQRIKVKPFGVLSKGTYYISFNVEGIIDAKRITIPLEQQKYIVKEDEKIKDIVQKIINRYEEEQLKFDYGSFTLGKPTDILVMNVAKTKTIREIPMFHARLQYKLLPEDAVINTNPNECVLDYMMTELSKVWPKYTRERLIKELDRHPIEGYSIDDIMMWAKGKNLSIYALDLFHNCIKHEISPRPELVMVFKINNDHCYGVFDKTLKDMVSRTKTLKLAQQVFEFSDWSSHEVTTLENYLENMNLNAKIIYINECADLCSLANAITRKSGYMLEYGTYKDACLEKMVNPINGQIIIAANKYYERKKIADDMLQLTNGLEFRFRNQSFLKLALAIMQYRIGDFGESVYSPDMEEILDSFAIGPWMVQIEDLHGKSSDIFENQNLPMVSFDRTRCYTHCLLENDTDYGIFEFCDDVFEFNETLPLKPGEYCLDKPVWIGNGTIRITIWQPLVMIKYLLKYNYISLANIKYAIWASKVLKADTFKKVITEMVERWPKDSKMLVNHFVGSLNRRRCKSNEVAMTDSFNIAYATYLRDPESIKIAHSGGIWILRKEKIEKMSRGNSPIWRHIIAQGLIRLDEMQKAVCDANTTIISYNTDSITVINPNPSFVAVEKSKAKIGDICPEPLKPLRGRFLSELPEDKPYIFDSAPWNPIPASQAIKEGCSGCFTGMPGCGKTQLASELLKDDKTENLESVVLSLTNCSAANIRNRSGCKSFTLDSFFLKEDNKANWAAKLEKLDVLTLEEYSLISKKWMEFIYLQWKKKKEKFTLRMFGDENQCVPIEDDHQWFSYSKSKAVRLMCEQNFCSLEYLKESGRYDEATRLVLVEFLKTGKVKGTKLWNYQSCDFNITATRATKAMINSSWHSKLKPAVTKKVRDLELFEGIPIISNTNFKTEQIYNSERYYVVSIDATHIHLKKSKEKLQSNFSERSIELCKIKKGDFSYGYADTVHRLQGVTIASNYNIWETDKMSLNNLYTALSRTTKWEQVGFEVSDKTYKFETQKYHVVKHEPIVSVGYIYKMWDDDGYWYIGRTDDPKRREEEHYTSPDEPEKMKTWLATGRKHFAVIDSCNYINLKDFAKLEKNAIQQTPNQEKSKNTQHILAAAQKQSETNVEVAIDCDRFNIVDGKTEFRIQWRIEGKQNKKSWRYNANNKEEKRKAAEEFRRELVKKYWK